MNIWTVKTRTTAVLLLFVFCFMGGIDVSAEPSGGEGFTLPQYDRFSLENGLTVYLMEQHEVPLIYVSAVFPAGAVRDGEKYGLASLTADAILFGSEHYTKDEIEETLDFLGTSYETSASREKGSISMSFLNRDRDQVFSLLKDIITSPTFDEKEFDKRKKRLLTELEQARERPASVIGSYFNKFLFGNHPYGNPVTGTRKSVSDITIGDVRDFYRSNYLPGASAVAVVGDFETSAMKKRIETMFGGWKVTVELSIDTTTQIPDHGQNRVLLVNKNDATETRFRIGSFGIRRSNPDYIGVLLVNTILGGRFTSWLNDELRVNAGLTYGAFSFFSPYIYSGTFTISSFTRTETTVEAIDLALEVLDRLYDRGIDEETLRSAKNYLKGQFPPQYETAGSLAELLLSMFIYGFDESFINNFEKDVDEMTVDKAAAIVQKYFPSKNLQFVLIGKADEIRGRVAKYGEISEREITGEGF